MLEKATQKAQQAISKSIHKIPSKIRLTETNKIHSLASGTAQISGLSNVQMNELLSFPNNIMGMVQTLSENSVGVIFLNNPDSLKSGDKAFRTHKILNVPVGDTLLGRVLTPLGEPLDNKGLLTSSITYPIERDTHPIIQRAPVDTPLQTGIKAIDSFIPIGRGQRELILGDRQTGKTSIAIDTILNQKGTGVICIYCAIGQRASNTAQVIDTLKQNDMLQQSIIIVADGDSQAGMQFIAPYSAASIGEYFMEQGKDVLIVYDDLTAHARAYRQLSLLLRTPPGREAYPGDIFYIHARLLERSTHLKKEFGGGSLTALPIVCTEAGNISAYIPTNIISITDGQIYLSSNLFQKGILPAIEIGRSVSRVGGDAQLPAYKSLIGPLKLFYAQFEELESFSKFGTQVDSEITKQLQRGKAIRLIMNQPLHRPMETSSQIAIFLATNAGLFDDIPEDDFQKIQSLFIKIFQQKFKKVIERIEIKKEKISPIEEEKILNTFRSLLTYSPSQKNDPRKTE